MAPRAPSAPAPLPTLLVGTPFSPSFRFDGAWQKHSVPGLPVPAFAINGPRSILSAVFVHVPWPRKRPGRWTLSRPHK